METKKVNLEVEIDTSVKHTNKAIALAKTLDAWRIFPRVFICMYLFILVQSFNWFISLPDPTTQQAGLVSTVIGVGAAWFGLYVNSGKSDNK